MMKPTITRHRFLPSRLSTISADVWIRPKKLTYPEWYRMCMGTMSSDQVRTLSRASRLTATGVQGRKDREPILEPNETDRDHGYRHLRRTALVIGSSGALGGIVARHLARDLKMRVLGADITSPSDRNGGSSSESLDSFIKLPSSSNQSANPPLVQLVRGVHHFLYGNQVIRDDNDVEDRPATALDAIVVASGGFALDPEPVPTLKGCPPLPALEQSALEYSNQFHQMNQMNIDPVVAAAFVARHYLTVGTSDDESSGGLLVVMGASAALAPTPNLLSYGTSKAAVHHLVQSVGAATGNSLGSKTERRTGRKVRKDLPSMDRMTIVGLLPTTIDTMSNRRAMPDADFASWTSPWDIAREIGVWIDSPLLRPHSGALLKVYKKQVPSDDSTNTSTVNKTYSNEKLHDWDKNSGRESSGAVFELVR
jgi:NAD(P)-dependent dehydrogenase (short-subunit alcohol dehydrogenase family)